MEELTQTLDELDEFDVVLNSYASSMQSEKYPIRVIFVSAPHSTNVVESGGLCECDVKVSMDPLINNFWVPSYSSYSMNHSIKMMYITVKPTRLGLHHWGQINSTMHTMVTMISGDCGNARWHWPTHLQSNLIWRRLRHGAFLTSHSDTLWTSQKL